MYHTPVSSTPTGFLRRSSVPATMDDADENAPLEAWPGPFSTARDMIAKRDAARKAREEAIAARGSGDGTASCESDELLDEYDRALKDLVWPSDNNPSSNGFGRGPVVSLTNRCATILAQHFDRLQGNEIGYLQIAEREKVAVELCKLRRCDAAAALKLAVDGSQYLVLPECSEIDEDTLMKAMEQASGVEASRELEPEEDEAVGSKTAATKAKKTKADKKTATVTVTLTAPESALRVLKLKNCGRGMSDRSAAACINLTRGALELLQLTGCYRLNDSALCNLLQASSTTLLSLDLSCNSRLGPQALRCIRSLPNLLELTLDNCTHLCDADLLHLAGDPSAKIAAGNVPTSSSGRLTAGPPPLNVLSLVGLTELTDTSIVPLIRAVGGSLQSLHLSGCVHLTDRTIRAIRRYCGHLQSLGLGQLSEVGAEAMVGLFIAHPAARRDSTTTAGPGNTAAYPSDAVSRTSLANNASASLIRSTSALSSATTSQSVTGFNDADDEELDGFDAYPHIGHLGEVLLQGNVSITDDVIIHLVESNRRTLRTLDVNGCHQLTSRFAAALRMYASRTLHSLDLSFVRGISQESLGALVDACVGYELAKITVWGCTQLGDKFFKGHINHGLEIVGRMTA